MSTEVFASYTIQDRTAVLDATPGQYVMRVRDLPSAERPREKMMARGASHLTIAELIAIIWGVGTRREDVLEMAKRTLREYGEKTIAHEQLPLHLTEAAGIPLAKACQLVAALELGRRFHASQSGRPVQVRTAAQAYRYVQDMGEYQKEQLRGLYLDSRYRVIHDEVISIGSLTANIVHPREVFKPAIERGAAAIVIAHNHPSGVSEPTTADIAVTRQLQAAGEVLGIDLLDHLVITGSSYKSVLDEMYTDD